MSNFDWAVRCVLHHEGGWSDDPEDRGGATNFGISIRYLQARGDLDGDGLPDGDLDGDGDVDVDDILATDRDDAIGLYKTGFWVPNRCDQIKSELVAIKIFDMAVNMGSSQAWKLVQRAANKLGSQLTVDGRVGPNTISAVNSYHRVDYDLVNIIRERQANFYETIIERNPSQAKFRLGWRRRAAF